MKDEERTGTHLMLTTMIGFPVSAANLTSIVGSYCGHQFAPIIYPPPCTKTITGIPFPFPFPLLSPTPSGFPTGTGTVIFRFKHSVPEVRGAAGVAMVFWMSNDCSSEGVPRLGGCGLNYILSNQPSRSKSWNLESERVESWESRYA